MLLLCIFALGCVLEAAALPASFYAENSRLASGRWARIEVKQSGMNLIPVSVLKALGFSDPSKVNVYGNGGRMLSENLNESMTDDLPILPSVLTTKGIVFFALDNVTWNKSVSSPGHSLNPYSDKSFYFISDSDAGRPDAAEAEKPQSAVGRCDSFTERLLHEQDITPAGSTGRLLLGEDFRMQTSRSFRFSLPGCIDGTASIGVAFGAKVTNGYSSVQVQINGNTIGVGKINGVASSDTFIARDVIYASSPTSEKLDVTVAYSHTGAVFTAALDYIEVFYPRELRLLNGQLYFYLQPRESSVVTVAGCDSDTRIWDVSDPVRPRLVDFSLSGSEASFVAPAGYREYVAFNPSAITLSALEVGKVANQNLHAMPAPGMLIIAPDAYRSAAEKIAALHAKTDGLQVAVLSPQQIYNEFSSGAPDVTAFRKLLKMWHDRAAATGGNSTRYCLIMSRPSYDSKGATPIVKRDGYPRLPIWQSPSGYSETTSFSTDDYIGMLDDNVVPLNMNTAKIHTAVGRMPVKSVAEADAAVAKLENYVLRPSLGSWRNNVMVIADDQDNGVHLSQAEAVVNSMRSAPKGKDYIFEKLYLDSYRLSYSGTGAVYPEAREKMFEKWNEGVVYIDYVGHASPRNWSHENLLTWTDIMGMKNRNLPFIYAATCEFLRWDADDVSGAEELWLNPSAGVIGMICPSRTVYISLNGPLNNYSSRFVFARDSEGAPMRVGDIMINGKNSFSSDNNRLRYALMGDPAMRLPVPSLDITVDRINGADLDGSGSMPVVAARSTMTLEGRVADANGNTVEDFNGTVELMLYDAEKVVTTNGNGADGAVVNYNDRKTRLYFGRVKAEGGKWTASLRVPMEIENNFSPALVSLYASDSAGREANGSCDSFYIYGFDAEAPADTEGPVISEFYLNSPAFSDGDFVSPSPMLHARMSDPSGINISDAGIGHKISIALDDDTFFNDAPLHYTPDDSDPGSGVLSYPLSGLRPGQHTLSLSVWDNEGNSSKASLLFNVSAAWLPEITTLTTDANPASSAVNFIVATDGAAGTMECSVEVIDLEGRIVWTGRAADISGSDTSARLGWDLCSASGSRVPRGIYLYRASVKTADGAVVSKTRKLAVTAP